MAFAMRVVCDEEGSGNSGKSNGNEDGMQAMAMRAMATGMATMWAMAMAIRRAGSKEGKGKGSNVIETMALWLEI
jgi:hypothetical protein